MNKIYEQWVNSRELTIQEKLSLKELSKQDIENFFKDENLHFGTAGIRGIMGLGTQLMNKYTIQQVACGYGKYLLKHFKKPSVVIGHDNRLNSDNFSLVCANVLTSMGIKTYLFANNHLTPTPIISYAIRKLKTSGGIIITASHNPKEYNGIKVYRDDGGQLLDEASKEVEALMPNVQEIINLFFEPNSKLLKYINEKIINKYLIQAKKVVVNKSFLKSKKDWSVVVTTHHGTASLYLPKWLQSLGLNVFPVSEQCCPDPTFKCSPSSNPEFCDSFCLAQTLSKKTNSNILIGVDPDADRMAVMVKHLNQWRLMTGNEMGVFYTYYLLNNKKYKKQPYIISTYVSTNYIDAIAKKFNANVYRTGVGFKYIGNKITEIGKKQDFIVGFEEAIGAECTTINRDKDSFTAALLALEIHDYCTKNNMDLVDYLHHIIFKEYGVWLNKTQSYVIKAFNWKPIAIKKMEYFKNIKTKKIGKYTIQKVGYNDITNSVEWYLNNNSWIKFRMSGTEPKFKIYYEFYGDSLKELEKNFEEIDKIFSKLITK